MKISNHIKSAWLSVQLIFLSGFRHERIVSQNAQLISERWFALTDRQPSDDECRRILYRVRAIENAYHRCIDEEETDVICRQVLDFPSI